MVGQVMRAECACLGAQEAILLNRGYRVKQKMWVGCCQKMTMVPTTA